MKLLKISVGIALAVLVVAFLFATKGGEEENKKISVSIGEKIIVAEVVDTPQRRTRGLSGRESLPDGEGMLFVFPEEDIHSIWMKGMLFSIDIIWIDRGLSVVGIEENVSPDSFPKTFSPDAKSLYVLELPAGFLEKEGIKIGDKMEFLPSQ